MNYGKLSTGMVDADSDHQPLLHWGPPQGLLSCSGFCSDCCLKRRAVRAVKHAQNYCAELQQQAEKAEDSSAPIAHLRAARQHLVVIEQWLTGAKSSVLDLGSIIGLPTASSASSAEDESTFAALFAPPIPGERLLCRMRCSVLSNGFQYHGHLFFGSERLCFRAHVLGVEARFVVPWDQVQSIRLRSAVGGDNSIGTTYVVFANLKSPTKFDSQEVSTMSIRLFDHVALGYTHRFATHFTGAGLFGSWLGQANDSLLEDVAMVDNPFITATEGSLVRDPEDLDQRVAVWQLERRATVWSDVWRTPFLPHDGLKRWKWNVIKDDRYEVHPSLPKITRVEAATSRTPPITGLELYGNMQPCTWNVVVDETTDKDGWQYAVDFYLVHNLWTPALGNFSHVRRRRWRAQFGTDEAEEGVDNGPSKSELPVGRNSTIMTAKGLSPHAGGRAQQLLELDLGEVPLKELGEALEADDWTTPGTLLADYFAETGAFDVNVGPWVTGASFAQVKGKVRSVDMRVKIPPQPMCPKESRCNTTWHVVADESKVVLESISMTLDVPYGDCFNLVTTDTFTLAPDTGHTRLVRVMGVDWVKSTWMKSLVESNLPPQVILVGEKVAKVVKEHVGPGGM